MTKKRDEIFEKYRPHKMRPLIDYDEYKNKYLNNPPKKTEFQKKLEMKQKIPQTKTSKKIEERISNIERQFLTEVESYNTDDSLISKNRNKRKIYIKF